MKVLRTTWMSVLIVSLLIVVSIPTKADAAKAKWEVKADQVIAEAKKHMHKEYKSSTNGPKTFDCSGYSQYVFKHGISYGLHRTTNRQATQGKKIPHSTVRKGDLLFYNTNNKGISHVAIYIGNGKMIHAASSKTDIAITETSHSYWKPRLLKTVRLLNI